MVCAEKDGTTQMVAPRTRTGTRAAWLALAALGVVRQFADYGPWAALIMVCGLGLLLIPLRRIGASKKRPGRGFDVLAVIFTFAALIAVSAVPFANSSNEGTGVTTSRHTNIAAAILAAGVAFVFWLWARWANRRQRLRNKRELS